jgi:hypothetical protein
MCASGTGGATAVELAAAVGAPGGATADSAVALRGSPAERDRGSKPPIRGRTQGQPMADRQVPGILVLLFALLAVSSAALLVLWIVVFDVASLAVLFVAAVYFLLVHVYLPYRVYVDARARGSDSAAAWAAVAFFLPLLGVVIYVLSMRVLAGRPA